MSKDAKGDKPAAPEEEQAALWDVAHIGESETHFDINYRYYLVQVTNAQNPQTTTLAILSLNQDYGRATSARVTIPFNIQKVTLRPETLKQHLAQMTNFAATQNLKELNQQAPSNTTLVNFKTRLGIPTRNDEKIGPPVQPGTIIAQVTCIEQDGVKISTSGLDISLECRVYKVPHGNSTMAIQQVQDKMQTFGLQLQPVDVRSI